MEAEPGSDEPTHHSDDESTDHDSDSISSHPDPLEDWNESIKFTIVDSNDILSISSKLDKFSVRVVGACLKLAPHEVDDVRKTQCSTRDRMNKLLEKWKDKNKANSTWKKLVQCLRGLNNDKLFEDIKDYLQTHYACTGTVLVMALSPSDSSISSLESSSTYSGTHNHLDNFSPSAVEETNACASSALVTGGRQPRDYRSTPANMALKQQMDDLQELFAGLLADVQDDLKDVSLDKIRVYLTELSMSLKEEVPIAVFNEHQKQIICTSTLAQVFQYLSLLGLWSFLNYYLLDKLVKKFGTPEFQARLKAYGEKIAEFKKETKLSEFLQVWNGRSHYDTIEDREVLIVRIERDWPDCTLAVVGEHEAFLESQFLIQQFVLHFSNAQPGCVQLMWLIPKAAMLYLKKQLDATLLSSNRIVKEVILGSYTFVMKVSVRSIPSPVGQRAIKFPRPRKLLLESGDFDTLYKLSIKNPHYFWGTLAEEFLSWIEPFTEVEDCKMEEGQIRWFTGGKLNVSVNCVDRHAKEHPERVALIWEKDEPDQEQRVTYSELKVMVCKIANVMRNKKHIMKGDVVVIFMPVCSLAVAAMLACARIGAVHCVLFSRLSSEKDAVKKLKDKLNKVNAKLVITANQAVLGGKTLSLKSNVDQAVLGTGVKHTLVYKRTLEDIPMNEERDEWLDVAMAKESGECEPEPMNSEDVLFIMSTSGASGESKDVVHTQAGYLLYTAVTHKYLFDYKEGDIFACVADLGWIIGHSYVVYGPLCNGATSVLFESTATYPTPDRYWRMVEGLKITHFYTIPSVIRYLRTEGDHLVKGRYDLSSLRILASAGEPLNAEAWKWYYEVVGRNRCPILDNWWQTELGGIAICPPLGADLKPGHAMKPFFGVEPVLLDDKGKEVPVNGKGHLYLKRPLPGMGRRLAGKGGFEAFKREYFSRPEAKGLYYTSDYAQQDSDGDYQILGRVDDIIRVKGVWLNTPKIENSIVKIMHEDHNMKGVVNASLIGCTKDDPDHRHASKLVTHVEVKKLNELSPKNQNEMRAKVQQALQDCEDVGNDIPADVNLVPQGGIPMTFSGKIVRHILRHVDCGHSPELGTSTPDEELYHEELKDIRQTALLAS